MRSQLPSAQAAGWASRQAWWSTWAIVSTDWAPAMPYRPSNTKNGTPVAPSARAVAASSRTLSAYASLLDKLGLAAVVAGQLHQPVRVAGVAAEQAVHPEGEAVLPRTLLHLPLRLLGPGRAQAVLVGEDLDSRLRLCRRRVRVQLEGPVAHGQLFRDPRRRLHTVNTTLT